MFSGVATMSRELVLGTVGNFQWVQMAGAIKNPDVGKVLDLSQATKDLIKQGKIKSSNDDVYVKLYPTDGYGNEDILYSVINQERPDAILHFTDPRFWGWLYQIEHTLRTKMPLTYLNIWDDIPYPMYNRPFYESCDALFSISKQTMNINKWVLGPENCCLIDEPMNERTLLHYVPHGIDSEIFKPLDKNSKDYQDRYKALFHGKKYDFVIFYNSRNVQRKRTSNIVLGYRTFCDNLPPELAKRCCLLLHTEIMHEAGTNLIALKEALCPDYDIIFSPAKLPPEEMPYLYNFGDVTINGSSNEGFGLSIAESLMCGTPIIATVTGGLQDQIGLTTDNGEPIEFNQEFGSNNCGKYRKHGVWSYPLWPATRMIQGSIPTPYIFDDIAKWEDMADAFMYWYKMSHEMREKCGAEGRRWCCNEGGFNAENMCKKFIEGMEYVFSNWKPRRPFSIYTSDNHVGNFMINKKMGFEIPTIDLKTIDDKIKETEGKLSKL